jgi:hypothetical protein
MLSLKTHKIDEFVDSDGGIMRGNDRNTGGESEIETGPVQKPFNSDSNYKKGISTTTDRATRYRQDIPWFAVYSYADTSSHGVTSDINSFNTLPDEDDEEQKLNEKAKIFKKNQIESEIKEDLVKKAKDKEVWEKDFDIKSEKIIDTIEDGDLTQTQLEKIKNAVLDRLKKTNA